MKKLLAHQKITAEDCDIFGHMNTLKYMEKFYAAADDYMMEYGVSDPVLAAQNIGCAYLEFNTKFVREVKEGEEVAISISVQEKGSKVVTIQLEMLRKPEMESVSVTELKFIFFDLIKRKSMRLADEKLKNLVSFL